MTSIANPNQHVHTGRQFADIVRHATAGQRAVLAHELRAGKVAITNYTLVQALTLSKASWTYAVAAHRLDDDERQRVWFERATIADFLTKAPTDEVIDSVIERLGVARVWAGLERATAPVHAPRANGARAPHVTAA